MPRIGGNKSKPAAEANGHTKGFAAFTAQQYRADEVVIGEVRHSPSPIPGIENEEVDEPITTASMTDLRKTVKGVRYLVPDWVPYGMVTMPLAEPGIGKSALVLYGLVRPIVNGGLQWFTGIPGPIKPAYVLWCDTEGCAAITIDRIQKWTIPTDRILLPFDEPLAAVNLDDKEHLERIERIVNQFRTPLVVVDSLRGAHEGDENSSRVGKVVNNLASIAERTSAAIVLIHHARKHDDDQELTANSSRGSNAILAMVRSQIGIDKPDKDSDWCRVQMLKENLGIKPMPIGFRVTSVGLEFGEAPSRPSSEDKQSRLEQAIAWLKEVLSDGPQLASEVFDKAKVDLDVSQRTLKAAKKSLDVESTRKGGSHGQWVWSLPSKGATEK